MAQPQMMQIKLSRFDAQPWGFRLQGGTDFAAPLLVQKVNGGSIAEKAGLVPGDSVLKINDVDVYNLRHKDAQDIVVRSGNNFVMTIQRGGSTWRPHVQPTGNLPQPNSQHLQTVTKTSLAHKQQESQHIGCGYNNAARPFGSNGVDGNVKSIVNKQYNSPVGIYSDESIAETLSAQAEVLAGGVLGVNFKKNEKEYQPDKSEVLKFLREEESGHSTPVNEPPSAANYYFTKSHAIGGNERRTPQPPEQDERIGTTLQQNTLAPAASHRPSLPTPAPSKSQQPPAKPATPEQPDPRLIVMPVCPALQTPEYKEEMDKAAAAAAASDDDHPKPYTSSGHPACSMCGVGIVGVFVRIKDKNLHVECFKCATCGTNLKNQGYYNFNNKLYCDIHAKLAAQQNPPAGTEGYVPIPIKPNTRLSASTISSALNTHGYNNGVSNGSSTPTPAPQEEVNLNDLPLPPPPSPTQLQQYEELNSSNSSHSNIPHHHQQQTQYHTRTLSSLSSMSSGSNTTHSSTHSLSPTPYNSNNYQLQQQQQQLQMSQQQLHQQPGDMTCESTLSLDHYGSNSPMHSRQTSSSSCSLNYGSGGGSGSGSDNYMMTSPPPPPPPPMPQDSNRDMCIKNQHNSTNVKLMSKQNENDMNSYNKAAAAHVVGVGKQQAYNKFLKEYSNKLLTQNSNHNISNNDNNNSNSNNTNSNTLKQNQNFHNNSYLSNQNSNSIPKPFVLRQTTTATLQHPSTQPQNHYPSNNNNSNNNFSNNNSLPNVAALTATLNNQLKFDSCQVAPTPCSNIPIVDKSLINSSSSNNNNISNSQSTDNINNASKNISNTTVTNEKSTTMASAPSVSELQQSTSIYGQIDATSTAATTNGTGATICGGSGGGGGSGDKPFEYVTLTGNVIRSVVPPGKGANVNYKVNQGYVRPFGAAPPAAAPKSPVSYPPQPQQWNAPPPTQPKPAGGVNPYATLPRSNAGPQVRRTQSMYSHQNSYSSNNYLSTQQQQQPLYNRNSPSIVGTYRYSTIPTYNKTSYKNNYNSYNYNQEAEEEEGLQPQYAETYFEEDYEVEEANRQMRSNFCWPPQQDDCHRTPTAAPLYIAPPETQHVVTKPIENPPPPEIGEKRDDIDQQQQQQPQSQPQWQSRSAPQLTAGVQATECESGSDSYTSTSTTTTTTSEEYQRMYAAQVQAYQMQQMLEQSGSEFDYHMDMEVASMQQSSADHLQLSSSEYLSGRRSAQECVESLAPTLSTYKLVDMVREVTPSPVPHQQGPRRVVFNDEPEVKMVDTPTQQGNDEDSHIEQLSHSQDSATHAEEARHVVDECDEYEQDEGLVVEDRSHILESQRIFQPTPEIKFEIAPVRQIPPTKIPNPTPKEWINPMVAVLTTAPETPFHMVGCLCPKPCDDCSCQAEPEEEISKELEAPTKADVVSEPYERPPSPEPEPEPVSINSMWEVPTLTKAMTIAPPFELKFAPPAAEGVPLPEETVPYMPPPIEIKPYVREDYRPKSPFVSALTTAPDRPFEGHFDRDVPIHLLDLPTPKGQLKMSDALCTASERPYTPLNPENATHAFEEQQKEQERKKYEFQVLGKEEELGIRKQSIDKAELYTTEKRKSSTSAFAAMQAFQPSSQPLSSTSTSATPRTSISYTKAESDLEYQKFCDAQDRYQKRRSYFSQKEQELLQEQQKQTHTTSHKYQQQTATTRDESSLYSSTKASSSSSNSSSAVQQQQQQQQPSSYASNLTQQASVPSYNMAYDNAAVSPSKFEIEEIIEETTEELEHSEVIFPPPSPLSHLKQKSTSTGLHRPETIPKYQRNWTVLPTQSPIRTPEPQELRENVPLAFVDTPQTPTTSNGSHGNTVHKPVARSSASAYAQSDQRQQHAAATSNASTTTSARQATKPTVPIIIEDRSGPVTMAFQALDEHVVRDQSQTPSRPFTPSRPAPIVPCYQTAEKLCFDECEATHARAYDRRSASPFPDRARSPAPGPPPNPLAAISPRAPRIKDNEMSTLSARGVQAGSITTGQSYLGVQQAQKQERMLSHAETSSQSGMQSYTQEPERREEYKMGNMSVQRREQASRMEEQKQRELQSQTTTQIGNTQIERRRKVTEEFEHTSSAKTVEIRTGSQSTITERRPSYGKGYVANQARRLSGLEQEITNLTPQSQAISARAANLTETKFPEIHSELSGVSKFPTKPVLPPHDEPKPPSYFVSGASSRSMACPSQCTQQQQREQQQLSAMHDASLVSSQQQQQQQQKSLSTYSSMSSSQQQQQVNTVSTSLTKASATTLTNNQAYKSITAGTNQNATSSTSSYGAPPTGVCPVTGTFCRPGHTCCKQQNLQINNNNRLNASLGSGTASNIAASSQQQQQQQQQQRQMQMQAAPAPAPAPAPASSSVPTPSNVGGSTGSAGGVAPKGGAFGATSAPKRGRGIMNKAVAPGVRVPLCNSCSTQIRLGTKVGKSLTKPSMLSDTLPRPANANRKPAIALSPNVAPVVASVQHTDLTPNHDPTAMLNESISKINMGQKMDNFMAEAGKVISNMLEARLANGGNGTPGSHSGSSPSLRNGVPPSSHSGSSLSLRSNSSSNLSRSPMVVRKRLDLDDFKDINPAEPAALKPVIALQQTVELKPVLQQQDHNAVVPVAKGVFTNELNANHPMGKVLDICDNKFKPSSPLAMRAKPDNGGSVANANLPPSETVIYRNNDRSNRRASHATDRRSYIETNGQNEQTKDGPAFSISVKALGKQGSDPNKPMSPENEEVVSQLLKEGKRPICCQCNKEVTSGPFITALGKIWCPEHFHCVNGNCRRPLQDIGFVEEKGDLYCEYCFEKYLAPSCSKCGGKIKGDCLNAIGKHFHPECFCCGHCGKLFGNTPFFLEDGMAYCENDWNELFTTKCYACGFPVEAGDRWVEALSHNYHSQCFNCTYCKQNLEGQSFYNKGGRPFCKNHAR